MLEQSVMPYVDVGYSLRLQIMDHVIGVFFKADGAPGTSPPSLLVVWKWTTGFTRTVSAKSSPSKCNSLSTKPTRPNIDYVIY